MGFASRLEGLSLSPSKEEKECEAPWSLQVLVVVAILIRIHAQLPVTFRPPSRVGSKATRSDEKLSSHVGAWLPSSCIAVWYL